MRVAICSDGVFPEAVGGIQRHTRLLVESLARSYPSLPITVLHTHVDKNLFAEYSNVSEVPVAARPGKKQYLLETYDCSGRMAEVLSTMPDAVIYSQGLALWKKIRNLGPRLILNPHGLEAFQSITVKDWAIGLPFRQIFRHLFRHPRFVVSLGGRLTEILRRNVPRPDARLRVIPNATVVPPSEPQKIAGSGLPLRLLFVGRFAGNKGIPDLLAAMGILAANGEADRFHLDLVGDGPLHNRLAGQYSRPNIVFHGGTDDATLRDLYAHADVFVLPTLFEGMPTVVLEAMAAKTIIVVTDVGATREMVDETNGFIIAKQKPNELAAMLRGIGELPQATRQAMMEASWKQVQGRFSWESVARAHYELFAEVDRLRRSPAPS